MLQQGKSNLEVREARKKDLIAKALSFFDDPDKYPVVFEDKGRNYTARQAEEEGNYITFGDWYATGFSEEHWKRWSSDPAGLLSKD